MKKNKAQTHSPTEETFTLPLTTTNEALLVEGTDHQFRKTLYDLDNLTRALVDARKLLGANLGVTSTQYNILMIIAEKDGLAVREVAEQLEVSAAFVTAEINKLVHAELVIKQPHLGDQRRIRLSLTKQAESFILQLIPSLQDFNDRLFNNVTRQEFSSLMSFVTKLTANLPVAVAEYKRMAFSLSSQD